MIPAAEMFVGQPLARRLLEGYLRKDRIAGTFLFLGERGLGKTTLATIFARAIVCENNKANPRLWFCGECYACRSIAAGEQPEYVELRPVGKFYQVDEFEAALSTEKGHLDRPLMHPVLLSHKVFLFTEAHLIGNVIGDKLLKTLEEPPEATVFLLDTDKPDAMLATIRSRGNPIRLSPLSQNDLESYFTQTRPDLAMPSVQKAILLGGGRFVETVLLAGNSKWRDAIEYLGQSILATRRIPEAAASATKLGVAALWQKELVEAGLDEDEAERMIRSAAASKTDTLENKLKKRKNELEREALIASYSYAIALLVREKKYSAKVFQPFSKLKARVNQNVDPQLAQVAFENALR